MSIRFQEADELLERLPDIELPGWLPDGLRGWLVAGLLVLLALLVLTWIGERLRAFYYRSTAYRELGRIRRMAREPATRAVALRQVPKLVKKTAVALQSRPERVSGLAGEDLLRFLDKGSGRSDFSEGAGRLLLDATFASDRRLEELEPEEVDELLRLVAAWIGRAHA
jgi:hypothetical protein